MNLNEGVDAMKAYKLVRKRKENYYPLYVLANNPFPVGKWIDAECGPLTEDKKVKSKLGKLAYRPGFHLCEIPHETHIGGKSKGTGYPVDYLPDDLVWVEVEFSSDVNYQMAATKAGTNKKGKCVSAKAYIKNIPTNGYYYYNTNPQATVRWIICGAMKIVREVPDTEVNLICYKHGLVPLPRYAELKEVV